MTTSFQPYQDNTVNARVERLVARLFFGAGAAMGAFAALLYALVPLTLPASMRSFVVVSSSVLAGAFMLAPGVQRHRSMAFAAKLAGWTGVAMILCMSIALGEGVHSVALGFLALVICLCSLAAGLATGVSMALVCGVVIVGLALAEQQHLLRGAAAVTEAPLLLRLIAQLLLVLGALIAGTLITRVTASYHSAAAEREQRFRGLLGVAADWYWELDDQLRFATPTDDRLPDLHGESQHLRGLRPWQVPDMLMDANGAQTLRQHLEARRPFRGLLVRRADLRGRPRYTRISGEPRFDGSGRFIGYWGVGHDVTSEVAAQRASAASEARYRRLFDLTPSPLLVHRDGRVIDANPAAVALFGRATLDEVVGTDLTDYAADATTAALMRGRIDELEASEVGTLLPPAEMRLIAADGRRKYVRSEAVRVQAAGGDATLALLHDETEQRRADAALRRSNTLLTHLIETSPDVITLTMLDTGRFVMVNHAWAEVFGIPAEEAMGRTSVELGVWASPGDRAAMVEAIRRDGRVHQYAITYRNGRGERVLMSTSGATFRVDNEDYLVLVSRDVREVERTRLQQHAILDNAQIGIAFTRERRFVLTNPHFDRMFGWPPGALLGQPGEVVWVDDAEYREIGQIFGPRLERGEPVDLERPMRRRDGTSFWCRLRAVVVDPSDPSEGGTIWLAEDVTERRRVEEALAAARDAAEAASRAKSAFLANTSHEIRTPLNGLLGLARLAMQPALAPERRDQYLAQIHDSAQSLAAIISDILDLSKIEAGKITLESVPFSPRDMLNGLHHAYRSLAEAKGLALTLSIADEVPAWVGGDPLRVRQILSNYLTNALKFTERGAVHISAGWRDARLVLSVTDTGSGIDEATQRRLFMPFTQADESTTRRFGGTGLGLSICRELAQLMRGRVGVSSREGQGSTFWAELPLSLCEAPDGEAGDDLADEHLLQGARVLMVEDNPVNMMIATAMLEQWGIQVTQAADGRHAIDTVRAAAVAGRPFELVLLDVHMPGMSGHEVARELRAEFDPMQLPIVALTAAALVSERDTALASGMDDFLTKPVDASRLQAALLRQLRRRAKAV